MARARRVRGRRLGGQFYREILASEELVYDPGNGALAIEECVLARASRAVAKVRVLTS